MNREYNSRVSSKNSS